MLKKMEKTRWLTFGMLILVLTLFISNFGSAYDFSNTWSCSNGLLPGCQPNFKVCSDKSQKDCYNLGPVRPVYRSKPDQAYQFTEILFNSNNVGNHNCSVEVTETGYGYYDGPQKYENSDIWINGQYLGRTEDWDCNSGNSCKSSKSGTSVFNKEISLTKTNNKIKLQHYDSHGLTAVKISCDYIPPQPICTEGETKGNPSWKNNFCSVDNNSWGNYSQEICRDNGWVIEFFSNKTQDCEFGCSNGDCLHPPQIPISNLTINITNPLNHTTYISDKDIYEIDLNVTANQTVQNWSVNETHYSYSDKNLNIRWNITLGENTIDVCGTNENGTSCDSVVVYLLKEINNGDGFWVNVTSPEEGKTYDNGSIWLNISSENATEIWYNWNGTNVSYSNPILIGFPERNHTIHVWGTNGTHIVYQNVTFEIKYSNGGGGNGDGGDDEGKSNGCKNCARVDSGLDEDTIISLVGNNTVLEYHSVSKEKDSKSKFKPNFIWTIIILVILILIILILLVLVS